MLSFFFYLIPYILWLYPRDILFNFSSEVISNIIRTFFPFMTLLFPGWFFLLKHFDFIYKNVNFIFDTFWLYDGIMIASFNDLILILLQFYFQRITNLVLEILRFYEYYLAAILGLSYRITLLFLIAPGLNFQKITLLFRNYDFNLEYYGFIIESLWVNSWNSTT